MKCFVQCWQMVAIVTALYLSNACHGTGCYLVSPGLSTVRSGLLSYLYVYILVPNTWKTSEND